MAYPVVTSVTQTLKATNGTTHVVALPATVDAGDVLLVLMAFDGQPTLTWDNSTAGTWTLLHDTKVGTAATLAAYWKVASGTEDGLSLSIGLSTTEQSVAQVFRFTGALSVECGTAVTSTAATGDCPNLTPSWGADDTLWIAALGINNDPTVTVDPTGYSASVLAASSATAGTMSTLVYATKSAYGASENPSAYTISASQSKVAQTYGIRPSTTGLTATGSVTLGAVTSTGTITVTSPAILSGSATLSNVTATGTLTVVDSALLSGSVTLGAVTATGSLTFVTTTVEFSGSVTLGSMTATGTLTITGEGRPEVVRDDLYAVELTAAIDAAGALQTFYISDAEFITEPTDTPPNVAFDPGLTDPGSIGITAFADSMTSGSTKLSLGEVRINNTDGRYDGWLDYGFDGRNIIIRRGGTGAYPADFTEVFSGTMAGMPLINRKEVVVRLRDRQYIFSRPALTTTYAGDNALPSGLEGTETDLKGQVKPRLYGKVLNIAPPCVNTSKLTYQISDGGLFSIDGLYDRGAPITLDADYATAGDLQAATVAGGTYATCISAGLFRLGGDPEGQITCDATQGAGPAQRTAAQILKALAIAAGVAEADVSDDDVTALDSDNPSTLGLWINTDETFASLMDRVSGSVGAYYAFDQSGILRMGRLTTPAGQPELSIEEFDTFEPFERRPARDGDIPVYRVTVRYARNWTVQESDLAESVDPARRASLASEWRSVVAEDLTVKNKHPLAEEWVVDTLIQSEAEALTEAERLLAIYSQRTDFFDVTVRSDLFTASGAWLMASTALTNPRFALDQGRLFRTLGIKHELRTNKTTLSLWGPPTDVPPLPPPPDPPPPTMPGAPVSWLYMWEAVASGAYVLDRMGTVDVPLRNHYGAGEIRTDGNTSTPALTRFDADGPLGAGTATTVVFPASAGSVFEVVGSDTYDLVHGADYEIEFTLAASSGPFNYRIGQTTGTAGIDYKSISILDEGSVDFTDPDDADIYYRHTFTADSSKKVGLFPASTPGAPQTLRLGSIRLRKTSDPEFVPLTEQVWGGWASRGTASAGGITLNDGGFHVGGAGASDGLVAPYPSFPTPVDFSEGKLTLTLHRVRGGDPTGSFGNVVCDDFDPGLSPTVSNTRSGITMEVTQEGQLQPQPNYSNARHGWNMIGAGYVVSWNLLTPTSHSYGVNRIPIWTRDYTHTAYSSRGQRIGSYNGTRDITHATNLNDQDIAAVVTFNGTRTIDFAIQAVEAILYDFEQAGFTAGTVADVVPVIGDSNDVRAVNEHLHRLSTNGFLSPGANVWLRDQAVGGRGLYYLSTFDIHDDLGGNGFVDQLASIMPTIEGGLAEGAPTAVLIRGYTNDADQVEDDRQQVWDDYVTYLYAPILATGADLLLMDPIPDGSRFTEANVLWIRAQMAAYAAAHPGRVWHYDSGNTGLFDVANQEDYYLETSPGVFDLTHLDNTTGDVALADADKILIETWRAERVWPRAA